MTTPKSKTAAMALFVALMAGCTAEPTGEVKSLKDEVKTLSEQNKEMSATVTLLRWQLETEQAQKALDLDYAETQANVAAVCDAIVPVCSDAVATTGREFQAAGYGGGAKPRFWVALTLKLLLLAATAGAFWAAASGAFGWLWVQYLKPTKEAAEAAAELVSNAQQRVTELQQGLEARKEEAAAAERRIQQLNALIESKRLELSEIERELAAAKQAAAEEADKAEKLKAKKNAIAKGFS